MHRKRADTFGSMLKCQQWRARGLNLINFEKRQYVGVGELLIMKKEKLGHTQHSGSETLGQVKEAREKEHACESIYMKFKNKKNQSTVGKNHMRSVKGCGGQGPARKGQENFLGSVGGWWKCTCQGGAMWVQTLNRFTE